MKNYGNYPATRRKGCNRNPTPNYESLNEAMRQLYAKDEKLTETCQTPMDKCLEAMNERLEDFTEEIEEGLFTFQCVKGDI